MPQLVLASSSPYRRQALGRLGVDFISALPDCDEGPWKERISDPQALAQALAEAKAQSLRKSYPDAIIIGSDQVAEQAGRIFDKPGSRQQAIAQLSQMQGQVHHLITALCVITATQHFLHCDRTALHMRPLSAEQIAWYIDRDQPFDCAGSYKLEAAGIGLFTQIISADHTAITGLPLIALTDFLNQAGLCIPPTGVP